MLGWGWLIDFDTAILGFPAPVSHRAQVTISNLNNLSPVIVAIVKKHDECNDRLGTNPVMLEEITVTGDR